MNISLHWVLIYIKSPSKWMRSFLSSEDIWLLDKVNKMNGIIDQDVLTTRYHNFSLWFQINRWNYYEVRSWSLCQEKTSLESSVMILLIQSRKTSSSATHFQCFILIFSLFILFLKKKDDNDDGYGYDVQKQNGFICFEWNAHVSCL